MTIDEAHGKSPVALILFKGERYTSDNQIENLSSWLRAQGLDVKADGIAK